jgi:hypothetical protein
MTAQNTFISGFALNLINMMMILDRLLTFTSMTTSLLHSQLKHFPISFDLTVSLSKPKPLHLVSLHLKSIRGYMIY